MLHLISSLHLISLWTLTQRETKRFLRLWAQTILPPLITTFLYFLIFGRIMGERIQAIQGIPYMAYISPGLIMMTIVTNAFSNTSSSLFGMRFQKCIEELVVAPISDFALLSGFVLGGVTRGLIVGALTTVLTLCFTPLPVTHLWVLLAIVPSTAILFSLAGFLNALYAENFDHIAVIPTFVLTPLTSLGGVFYPIDALPSFWKTVCLFNPFVYIVNAFRYALLGVSDVSIGYSLLVVWLCCAGLVILNLYLLRIGRGLRS